MADPRPPQDDQTPSNLYVPSPFRTIEAPHESTPEDHRAYESLLAALKKDLIGLGGDNLDLADVYASQPYPPGHEWAYAQRNTSVGITGATEFTGNTILTIGPFVPDGKPVMFEFYAPFAETTASNTEALILLFEGSTEIGRLAVINQVTAAGDMINPIKCEYRFTPSAASHTYTITGWLIGGACTLGAGFAGTSDNVPIFARVVKV